VRGFRAIYLGLCLQLHDHGDGELAACKIAGILFGLPAGRRCVVGVLTSSSRRTRDFGARLVIDMIQFFIKMTAVIAARTCA
jgi:hypothetical protein